MKVSTRLVWGISLSLTQCLLQSNLASAWGHLGHEKLAEVAATLTTDGHDFWNANMQNLGVLANVPDVVWKSTKNAAIEKPTHFFQPDSYIADQKNFSQFPRDYDAAAAKYTAEALDESGTATWRAKQLYDLAVEAFKSGDFKSGLEYAGTMSHYVGDISQPLHVTKNYDGQETGDKGIHAFFETKNLQSVKAEDLVDEVTFQARDLLNDASFRNESSGTILDTVFNEVNRSYAKIAALIDIDLKLGRFGKGSKAQLDLAQSRLADGAATLAIILSQIWRDAGSPQSQDVEISAHPQWVRPDYSKFQSLLPRAGTWNVELDDDCQQ